jgi:hypothetical protein
MPSRPRPVRRESDVAYDAVNEFLTGTSGATTALTSACESNATASSGITYTGQTVFVGGDRLIEYEVRVHSAVNTGSVGFNVGIWDASQTAGSSQSASAGTFVTGNNGVSLTGTTANAIVNGMRYTSTTLADDDEPFRGTYRTAAGRPFIRMVATSQGTTQNIGYSVVIKDISTPAF